MNKIEQLDFLIEELIGENIRYKELRIPEDYNKKRKLLRSLMNVREPCEASEEFIKVQDEFLKKECEDKGIVKLRNLPTLSEMFPAKYNKHADKITLWQGDITRLKVDAIVNAANNQMLGCFVPCHGCIDNAIHSAAGIELRIECDELMKKQGFLEPTGNAKITGAYNLPCKHIIHTVGPIIVGFLRDEDCKQLDSCYKSCLKVAVENNIKSIAFCCISTGEFHFPNKMAAEIAIKAINNFLDDNSEKIERIVINVFKEEDFQIYKNLLG
ncbi:protein-ADP-ribose hydrolase [Clostridium tyrobutyricum]|jgi:O-acetyl-ADP-ribose deacetylase (regulator of RNase III)|uniref:protein-ADP-ribose hydrolase n=1 Tax=Clostridium tyrobutyricum TaxID=1519 RepID=UPI000313B552|nr:protein-ADP-ribose hydrolase [Clostridium tyrobutyricum]MEA5008162.1 protein-ADP-ribose hydrolase [Clostridium tyrobutyricum]